MRDFRHDADDGFVFLVEEAISGMKAPATLSDISLRETITKTDTR
jgi:hypothetical protein